MPNIGLKPEYVASLFGILLTNTFLTSILVTAFLLIYGLIFYLNRKNNKNLIINAVRTVIFRLLKMIDGMTQDRKLSERILPLIATFFLFIVASNLLALIPGFLGSFYLQTSAGKISFLKSSNSDLTTTLALALFSVVATQFLSVKIIGLKDFLGRFLNFSSLTQFILGFLEIISEAARILSFSFRLFGNIFAGEVLMLVVAFLVPYFVPLPFMILEVFVGIIQAFIFAALTMAFIRMGTLRPNQS